MCAVWGILAATAAFSLGLAGQAAADLEAVEAAEAKAEAVTSEMAKETKTDAMLEPQKDLIGND